MTLRVCIPTAGTGSRLGELTRHVNKSLVAVDNRPILSHIVEKFPADTEFVIALGHKGHLVREFIALAYPGRVFHFAEVDPFEGPGSGLGLSLLACRSHLQQPFVFISCDTLVEESVPLPDHDWMGFSEATELTPYRTLALSGDRIQAVCDKGVGQVGTHVPYIGLAGIHDHYRFWEAMTRGGAEAVVQGEAHGLAALLDGGVRAHCFTWHDTGTPAALAAARARFQRPNAPTILEKANEAIWFVDGQAIKYSDDTGFIAHRVQRAAGLEGFVPAVTGSSEHMYRYPMAAGQVLSEVVDEPLFTRLLEHCRSFWRDSALDSAGMSQFRSRCLKFYRDKTFERVELFYRNFDRRDGTQALNSTPAPTLEQLLCQVDWEDLSNGLPGRFHGDFHFENILWNAAQQRFTFLDWRQDFGGDLRTGDLYYDFAKLLHGLIVSHKAISRDLYSVHWTDARIDFDLMRPQMLVRCEQLLERWILEQGYDLLRVRQLTALIFLNIAALHHHPYSLFLYALGKDMLGRTLES